MPGAQSFDYWFTTEEVGSDYRTGAIAKLRERSRIPTDRKGKGARVWDWVVVHGNECIARGTSQTQGAARRKCRDVVGKLPDKGVTPPSGPEGAD